MQRTVCAIGYDLAETKTDLLANGNAVGDGSGAVDWRREGGHAGKLDGDQGMSNRMKKAEPALALPLIPGDGSRPTWLRSCK
jgi:hypothetical protein